jgi:hypothetical protein
VAVKAGKLILTTILGSSFPDVVCWLVIVEEESNNTKRKDRGHFGSGRRIKLAKTKKKKKKKKDKRTKRTKKVGWDNERRRYDRRQMNPPRHIRSTYKDGFSRRSRSLGLM